MTKLALLRDITSEAISGLLQRPGRSALTMVGTFLGIGSFVAIIGITATAEGQISDKFDRLGATEVSVDDIGSSAMSDGQTSFPLDASQRAQRVNGVVDAGVYWAVNLPRARIANSPTAAGDQPETSLGLDVVAADPDALSAMGAELGQGRFYDAFAQSRGERVAILGDIAATALGITRLDSQPAVFIDDQPYTVLGIASRFGRQPGRALSVIIPTTTANREFGPPLNPRPKMLVVTRLGAAQTVAEQLAVAIRPDNPDLFQVLAPLDPRSLREGVQSDFNALFLLLASISLAIGAVGIVNTTLVAVIERTPEIGLRRALGAQPSHIAWQFLGESTTLGLMGGLLGTSIAVLSVVLLAIFQNWTAILPAWAAVPAPAIGAAVGLLAGLYPALRAARVEPVQALQR